MAHPATIAPDLARQKLLATVRCVTLPEDMAASDALGRIMAADMVASHNLPTTANAAVDGYALHAGFLAAHPDHNFPIVGRAAAGHPFTGTVTAGNAIRIFTGAVMPDGPDAVVMHEDCDADTDHMRVHDATARRLRPGSNHRPAGENIAIGETIIPAGKRLGPADLGIAAAAGFARLSVRRRLRVGLLSMGDEIIAAGTPVGAGQSHDSNRPMLRALIEADGHEVHDFGIIADDAATLTTAYAEALAACDVVISSGGASDGDEDHTQQALTDNDMALVFWRLAMKPGRPMAVGASGDKRVFCLPGNPVAAFVCYRLLTAPVLAVMAGGIAGNVMRLPVQAGFAHKKSAGRAEYLRVRLASDPAGMTVMHLHGRRGAGVLSSLTGADGIVEIPVENTGVNVGDYLGFIPFREAAL